MKIPTPLARLRLGATIVCAIIFTLGTAISRGELIFSDSFNYSKGALEGKGPPHGSPVGQSAWMNFNGNPFVASPGLDFEGVFSHGKSAIIFSEEGDNGDKAVAELRPVTAADAVVWVGFLVRRARGSFSTIGYSVVSLGNDVTGPSLGIGKLFDKRVYGLDNNTGADGSKSPTTVTPDGDTVWLVTKVDFTSAQEYLWINPASNMEPDINEADASLPMTDEFLASGFHEIVLKIGYVHARYQFDELRVATNFAEVVAPSGE